jgi:hypothetical protein
LIRVLRHCRRGSLQDFDSRSRGNGKYDQWLSIFRRRRCFGEYVVLDKREERSHVKGDPCFERLPPANTHPLIAILVLVLILGEERGTDNMNSGYATFETET